MEKKTDMSHKMFSLIVESFLNEGSESVQNQPATCELVDSTLSLHAHVQDALLTYKERREMER